MPLCITRTAYLPSLFISADRDPTITKHIFNNCQSFAKHQGKNQNDPIANYWWTVKNFIEIVSTFILKSRQCHDHCSAIHIRSWYEWQPGSKGGGHGSGGGADRKQVNLYAF